MMARLHTDAAIHVVPSAAGMFAGARLPVRRSLCLVIALAAGAQSAFAQAQPAASAPAPAPAARELVLFAVEIKVGPKWDQAKPPQEQLYFKEHSANLKRLRDAGSLVMGARYADKGLVVLAASSEAQARAMMDEDPSMKAQVFKYELHPFNVFYPGTVQQRSRLSSSVRLPNEPGCSFS